MEEAVLVVCPNPRCRREFEEPILLTILSVTPPKQYEACPYCFAKLEQEPPIEQKAVPEPRVEQEEAIDEEEETAANLFVNAVLEKVKVSSPRFFKKVKSLIPNTSGLKKEKNEKTKDPQAEPTVKEEKAPKEKPKTEPNVKKEEPKEAFQMDSSGKEETAKEESKTEPSAKKESGSSGCPEAFGYLANRPKDVPIPQGCLTCPKMVDCILSPRED